MGIGIIRIGEDGLVESVDCFVVATEFAVGKSDLIMVTISTYPLCKCQGPTTDVVKRIDWRAHGIDIVPVQVIVPIRPEASVDLLPKLLQPNGCFG